MKIALVTDTHFGWKNDSIQFHDYFVRFYNEVFFPELAKRKIKTIIHLGDLFDRRKYINFHILHRTRTDFLEKLVDGKFDVHIIIGNHDTYFRDSNAVNSVAELVHERYPKFHVYEEPEEVTIDGLNILMVPWLNSSNTEQGLQTIAASKADVLMGHLEIAGFHMDRTQVSEHGLDRSIFNHYKKVFSGHFHHASEDGVIRYLGAPYEYTFADLEDLKGFYFFDTDTLELEFVQNPHRMFYRIVYDDREGIEKYADLNTNAYADKYVRVVVLHKANPVFYEQFIDRILQTNPADLQINEQLSLEVGEEADEQFQDFDTTGEVVLSDTLTILDSYVDSMGMELDRKRLKDVLRELYIDATTGMVTA